MGIFNVGKWDKNKKKFSFVYFLLFSVLVFHQFFRGWGCFLWGCFFFFGKPLLLYIVVGTCNLIKYLYIKKSRFVPFYLHLLPFHNEIYVLYIFKFNFNSMKNYNFLLPFIKLDSFSSLAVYLVLYVIAFILLKKPIPVAFCLVAMFH